MDSSHDRSASDRTVNQLDNSGQEQAAAQPNEQEQHANQTASSVLSDTASTPTPTATSTLFLGQQQSSQRKTAAAATATPPKPNVPTRTASVNASQNNVSAVPMGSSHAGNTSSAIHVPPVRAAVPTPLASPAFAQASALGRGRAPTLQSQPSGFFTTSGSPSARSSAGIAYAGGRPPGQGHRSMPSTSASLAFSDAAPTSSGNPQTGAGGNLTETESVFSGGEEDVYSQQYPGRKGRPPALQNTSTYSAANRSGRPTATLRPSSAAMGSKGKGRSRSRSNMRDGDSSSAEDDDDRGSRPSRSSKKQDDPVNPLPATARSASVANNVGIDDDEVERRDRGEELVRRRMRERRKEKKDAERRERKRRDDEMRRDQERQTARSQKVGGTAAQRESFLSDGGQVPASYDDRRPGISRRSSTDPTVVGSMGTGAAPMSRGNTYSREVSMSGTADGLSPYSPTGSHIQGGFWPPPHTSSTLRSATPTPQSPFFPPQVQQQQQQQPHYQQQRRVSYATSQGSLNAHQAGERDIFGGGGEEEENADYVPELGQKDGVTPAWREEVARSVHQDFDGSESGARGSEPIDEPSSENEDADEDEEDDSNEDVEYTLKDRQDAINIEHPFGLPIWKPALYKKNRSVHRNADKELHLAPSFTAERHLLPGNLVWALFFGWWMALFSMLLAGLMCLVPFGGVKYGRVIWELGGYLFWPFGKYVERYDEGSSEDDLKGYDEMTDDGEDTVYDDARARDVGDAGKTWGRQSGRSTSSAGTVKKTQGSAELQRRFEHDVSFSQASPGAGERTQLLHDRPRASYGAAPASPSPAPQVTPSGSETEVADRSPKQSSENQSADLSGHNRQFRIRASGRVSFWLVFYLLIAPMMLLVCTICWACIFTIPMAKLLWILLRDLNKEPLALHFRSPSPHYVGNNAEPDNGANGTGVPHLEAGQRAPRHSRRTYDKSRAMGRLVGPNSTIILCTYKAMGLKYYKYTIDGTNVIFINLLPVIAFVIFDFFVLFPATKKHDLGGFIGFLSAQGTMFMLALLSVIPLSYFIGMGVASISAQSSIGMGAVINATFGSIIEIILYSIALTQSKGQLVEGSIVGSLLAGVLLMPGLSMVSGSVRRKEQRFNARSAGVTSTMLIMAIIGILTPTLFYEIYGTFQLTCNACPVDNTPDNFTCRRCFYEHVDPVDDEFYKSHVQGLSHYCAVLLVLSYLIGLWFSLRTHASQIWQNQQHVATPAVPHSAAIAQLAHSAGVPTSRLELPQRNSMYKRLPQAAGHLLPGQRQSTGSTHAGDVSYTGSAKGSLPRDMRIGDAGRQTSGMPQHDKHDPNSLHALAGFTAEEVNRAFHVVAATASALQTQQQQQQQHGQRVPSGQQFPPGLPSSYSTSNNLTTLGHMSTPTPGLKRQPSQMHEREISKAEHGGEEAPGGHDAPNWSRTKSYSVLVGCTVLYAIIAEILVDVVDVVLEGSGIPEKFLGITLFALVPNVTEFMNAISFAMNGNIALSMEIGSAYALQVCLLQIPAMICFTYFYGRGKESMLHQAFSLVFPRWDAISIMFSVFLLTYTYIEARSNYYRGSILVISYLVLLGGFAMAPHDRDTSDDPLLIASGASAYGAAGILDQVTFTLGTLWNTLFSR